MASVVWWADMTFHKRKQIFKSNNIWLEVTFTEGVFPDYTTPALIVSMAALLWQLRWSSSSLTKIVDLEDYSLSSKKANLLSALWKWVKNPH